MRKGSEGESPFEKRGRREREKVDLINKTCDIHITSNGWRGGRERRGKMSGQQKEGIIILIVEDDDGVEDTSDIKKKILEEAKNFKNFPSSFLPPLQL